MAFVVVLLVAMGPTAGAGAATKVRPQALGGFRGTAAASGLHVIYNPKGLLPTGAPVDLGSPDSLATLSTGPTTFARAGVADPGDLLANPDALLSQADPSYPSGTIPSWPLRITASSAVGEPVAESNPGPGLKARVEANRQFARATASMPGSELPAVATVSSVATEAAVKVDDALVTMRSVVRTTGFNLLGIVKIDAIVTDFTATSDAVEARFGGVTTLTGVTVMGRKATIDSDGIKARSKSAPDLNAILSRAGIKVSVADPVTSKSGAGGLREGAGLRIDLEFSASTTPALAAILDALPPLDSPVPGAPGAEDLIAVAKARNMVAIYVGGALVSVDARTSAQFDAPVPQLDDEGIVPSVVSGFADLPGITPLTPAAPSPAAITPTAATRRVTNSPLGRGIGGLLLVALLAQPILGYRLARGSAALLGGAAPDCTEEEL